MEIVAIISLVVLVGAAVILLSQQKAARTLTAEKDAALRQLHDLAVEKARLEMAVATLRERAASDKQELEKLQETFRTEFRNLANDILDEKSKSFKETNKESLEQLLKPFRMNITDFRERVEKIYSHENEQRGALRNEIKNLQELNRLITQETTNLTKALKGNSKVQGDWGEMILETILENSNLKKGIHYLTQENIKDDTGRNFRPDVILHLPDEKQVVIDSKVSLTSFVEYVNAEDEPSREAALKRHIASIRRHIDELGSKQYQRTVNSTDFVIMFVANEPAFLAAIGTDNSLWSEAYNKKVIISSPTNLFALLKMVDDLWKRDNQSKNAIAIAQEAAKLYDKFVGFVDTLKDVGKGLDNAKEKYDKALGQLHTGRGNLVTRSEKLREMGVKATKSLPIELTDAVDE